MELSIVITSFKNPDLLKVCIDSIKRNITLSDLEIIVADSATEEDTKLLMKEEFPEIKFFPNAQNLGFQALVKEGYVASRGDYILILNGDIIVKKDSIENLLNFVKNNSEVGVAGPKLLNFNETLQFSCFRFYTPMAIVYRRTFLGRFGFAQKQLNDFLMKDFDRKTPKEVDWIMGSAHMVRRTAVEKVGLMDSQFKMYFEDVDWCRRFWENGYKVMFFPDSLMYHYHGKGSAGRSIIKTLVSNRLAWLHIISAIRYFIKYWGKPLPKHN